MKIVLSFTLCAALLIGGILLFGYAFTVPDYHIPVFFCGVLSVALAFLIPMTLLRNSD